MLSNALNDLMDGIVNENLDQIVSALKRGASVNGRYQVPFGGFSFPICYAIGNPALTEALLDLGADPNVRDSKDSSPLDFAVATFESEVEVALLLAKGANPNLSDSGGYTPLMLAATESGPIAIRLLKAGADVNARTKTGWTVLMAFSVHGLPKFVEVLLKCGANPFDRDKDGMTAMSHARKNGRVDIIEVLNR